MTRHDVAVTLGWMRRGQRFLADTVDALTDVDLREPSTLPDWTRAHVVGHLARNAEALTRLAGWARTGIEAPMYADAEQRTRDIETSAQAPEQDLREELRSTGRTLDDALEDLDAATWQATVRSAQGRTIPATEIPWMRAREVWLHAVDLGAPIDALPAGMAAALLDDVTGVLSARDGCPSMLLRAADQEWRLGPGEPDTVVTGAARALAGWLTGRASGDDLTATTPGGTTTAVPTAPRWL